MDERSRIRQRGVEGDPESLVAALAERLRGGERARVKEGQLVGGLALATLLTYLLEASGQREIEVLRASPAIEAKHHGRWIESLRALLRGEFRSWVWVERWAELLAFDRELLALAVDCLGAIPQRFNTGTCVSCSFLRRDLTLPRHEQVHCAHPESLGLRIRKPHQHTCPRQSNRVLELCGRQR